LFAIIVNRKIHYKDYEGVNPLITPFKKAKKLKTTEGERVSLSGTNSFIIPFFRHPGNFRVVFSLPLNSSITTLSVIPECIYQESKLLKGKNIWTPDKSAQA